MIRNFDLEGIGHTVQEALRQRFGPEPSRTLVGVLFAVLLLVFYVLYAATHFDR
jgi:hypothetical protein